MQLQKRKAKNLSSPKMIGSIYYLQQQFLVGEMDMSHATNLSDGQMQRWNLVQGINCRPVCREATARVHCTLHGKLVVAGDRDSPPQRPTTYGQEWIRCRPPGPAPAPAYWGMPCFHTDPKDTHTDTATQGRAHTVIQMLC